MNKKKSASSGYLITVNCKRCGKEFVPAPEHIFRDGDNRRNFYCTWSCYKQRKAKTKEEDAYEDN